MSESSRRWLSLAAVAVLSAIIMGGGVVLLVAVLPPRTNPVAQAATPPAERPPAVADTLPPEPVPPADTTPTGSRGYPEDVAPLPPPPVPVSPSSTGPPTPPDPVARWKVGDAFMQELVVTRRSAYRILGADVGQAVRYVFVSRFTVDKVERDGGLVVKQKIEEARFSDGDPAMQALLNDSLKKTQGADFEIALDGKGRVTRFRGAKEPPKVFAGNDPLAGQTFLLWSFLDDDAWKELAQITFFRPDEPLRSGREWSPAELSHSWGPLGSWVGQTAYVAAGKQAGMERINYTHEMTYRAPRGGGRDLPFRVTKADFKPVTASGVLLFDAGKGRVTEAEETFRVRGVVVVAVGDTEAAVEMDETQIFRLRVTDAPAPRR